MALSACFLAVVGITVIFKDRFGGFYRPGDRVRVAGIKGL